MTVEIDPNVGKEFIEHFGTKGMRWGVRKERTDYGHGKSKGEKKDGKKEEKKAPAKTRSVAGKTKTEGRDLSKLSDADLQKVISRMNMEQQYSKLTAPEPSRKMRAAQSTKKFVLEAARSVAMKQITSVGNDQATKVRNNLFPKLATQVVKKAATT